MTRTDQGYYIYDQVFESSEMARTLETLAALGPRKSCCAAGESRRLDSNGPLRVLPNSHLLGVLGDEQIEQLARETTAVECLAPSGGVVAMRPLTVHASSKSSDDQPRRVLHIEYVASVNLGSDVELAVG